MRIRAHFGTKSTVEVSTKLSIFEFNCVGLLKGAHATVVTHARRSGAKNSTGLVVDVRGEPYARLIYTIERYRDGSKEDYDYRVGLISTPCNFGGVRYWFLCPQCGRRVAKLYRKPMGEVYLCRVCNNLSYESKNASRMYRRGGIGYFLKTSRLIEELCKKIKRRTWRGRPTRNMRRMARLEQKGVMTRYPKWFRPQSSL